MAFTHLSPGHLAKVAVLGLCGKDLFFLLAQLWGTQKLI